MDWFRTVSGWVEGLSITSALWVFTGFFVIHELEEWNIARFERRVFEGLPAVHTDRNARGWIAIASLLGLAWCALASLPAEPSVSMAAFLPAVFVAATNALQHVYWSLRFRSVAPGVVSGVLLILPASVHLVRLAVVRELVAPWYVAALSIVALAVLAATIKGDTRAPGCGAGGSGLGARLARTVFPSAPARANPSREAR